MLTLAQISKSYAGRTLFEDASLQIQRGERVGLVGPNGAGKSTLFSIILGETSPDAGTVTLERGVRIGYLPQESASVGNETVLELACGVPPDDPTRWELEPKAKRILAGLAFRPSDFNRPVKNLSGGWVMRTHLARLLVQEPDLLLLDEPTNHLDLESLGWFQNYLQNYPGGILIISHDREFLNALVGSIVEIAHRRLVRYRGDWDDYRRERAAREAQHLAAYKNQQREIAALQTFADRFRAKASKASQAQDKLKQIARMEKIEAPVSEQRSIRFRFPQPPRSGQKVITLENASHAYGDLVVYRGINYQAERGQRTVLVGPNGAGKSTLLKLLAGVLPLQSGRLTYGANVKPAYFSQHRAEMLDPMQTVLQSVLAVGNRPSEQDARTVLGAFLFRGEDVNKPVAVLSGGEKTRLALVRLLMDPPNLLLMDEPTTHLDIGSIDALIAALEPYSGTLIFISHDVHFIKQIATSVLHISAGTLKFYPGDYTYYLDKTGAITARAALTAGTTLTNAQPQNAEAPESLAPAAPNLREIRRAQAEVRKAAAAVRRDWGKKIHAIEKRVLDLEARQKTLAAELEKPEHHAPGGRAQTLTLDLRTLAEDLAKANAQWLALAEQEPPLPSPSGA